MERQIRLAFKRATDTAVQATREAEPSKRDEATAHSKTLLAKAIKMLQTARIQQSTPTPGLPSTAPELLVIGAETALTCNEHKSAQQLAEEFFMQVNNTPDQFTCRALFIRAKTEAFLPPTVPPPISAAKPADTSLPTVNGAEALRRTLRAVGFILEAIEIAKSNPAYNFVIYNASVHYWNVARPAMRKGSFKYLSKSLEAIFDALAEVNDEDLRWRIQIGCALVNALDEAGEFSAAAQRITATVEIAREFLSKADSDVSSSLEDFNAKEAETKRVMKLLRSAQGEEDEDDEEEEEKKSNAASPRGGDVEEEQEEPLSFEELSELLHEAERSQAASQATLKDKQAFQAGVLQLCQKVSLLRLHIGRNASVNGDCKKLLDEGEKDEQMYAIRHRVSSMVALQKLKSGILEGKDDNDKLNNAANALNGIISEICPDVSDAPDGEDPPPPPAPPADSLEIIVDVGRVASHLNLTAIANKALALCKNGKAMGKPAYRVKLDYLSCETLATELDGKSSITDDVAGASNAANNKKSLGSKKALPPSKLDARHVDALRLSRRVEALKLLDRTIMSARRLGDPDLMQEGAVIAWNLGLPLLQPHLRKHVHRVFTLAAQVLGEINSPLTELRALLHLEVAKCELASDFLAKASQHVMDSIKQDYGVVDTERVVEEEMTVNEPPLFPTPPVPTAEEAAIADAKNGVLRPLDRYTYPLHRKLELRTSIYSEPDNAEERALLQLEQAKEVSDVGLRMTLLQKSALLLESDDEGKNVTLETITTPDDPMAVGDGEPMEAPSMKVKSQSTLWSEIATMAWSLRAPDLVLRASLPILSYIWSTSKNREYVVIQVKTQFTLAESLVETLKCMAVPPIEGGENALSKRPDPRALGIPCERDSILAPPVAFADKVDDLKAKVIASISCGITRAVKLGPSAAYLVESGAVLLWNYHIHIFRANAYGNIMPELITALKVASEALVTLESKDTALQASLAEALALSSEVSGDLNAAENYCIATIPKGRSMQVKRLVEILARVRYSRGSKDYAPPVDAKAGGKPNVLFNVSALCVAITKAAEKGEASLAERTGLLDQAIKELTPFKDARLEEEPGDTTREDDEERLEFESELWVRIANESLSQGLLRQAQQCCGFAVSQLPSQPELRKRIPTNVWRWFSVAECVWGRAIAGMVNEEGQDRTLQDELRRAALKRLVTACRHGSRARKANLVQHAAEHLWNIALPLTTSPISRKQIFPFVKHCLSEMEHAGVKADPQFTIDMFILLFECYADVEDWSGGLQAVNSAFLQVPVEMQRPLWQRRIVFMSKLGKGVLDGMQKMKESDPVLQSKVWAILARAASSTKQQMEAYVMAVESLKGRFERLEYCVEMAEWMIQSGLSKQDSNDVLQGAFEAFMQVEKGAYPEMLEDDEGVNSDDDMTTQNGDDLDGSQHTSASRNLTRQGSRQSLGSAGIGGPPQSATTVGTRVGTAVPPSSSQTTLRRRNSRASARSVRSQSSHHSAATSASGVGVGAKTDNLPNALNISHMTLLVRTLCMLSSGSDDAKSKVDMALSASHYAERCLLSLVDCANCGAAFEAFEAMTDEEKVEAGGLEKFTSAYEKPYGVPNRMEDWVGFELESKQFLHHASHCPSTLKEMTISNSTVSKPPLLLSSAQSLATTLKEEGLTLQALPLLTLAEAVSRLGLTIANPSLVSLTAARTAVALMNLGRPEDAFRKLATGGPYGLDNSVSKKYKEDVEQIEIQKYGHSLSGGAEVVMKGMVYFEDFDGKREDARIVKVKRVEIRDVWAALAEEMIVLEQPAAAKQYLDESLRHAAAFEDYACRSRCLLTLAKVAMLNGDSALCVEMCKMARFGVRKVGGADGRLWCDATMLMSSALLAPPMHKMGEAKKILASAYDIFERRCKTVPEIMRVAEEDAEFKAKNSEIDLHVLQCHAKITMQYANLLFTEALASRASGGQWYDTWKEALEIVNKSKRAIAGASGREPRPMYILVDLLEFEATWFLKLRPSDKLSDDLNEAISFISQAVSISMRIHREAVPPESSEEQQQQIVAAAEGEESEGQEEAEVALSPPPPSAVTLPTARRAAGLQIKLARLHIKLARLNGEHVSRLEAEEAYAKEVTNPVEKYLDATAPVNVTEGDVKVKNLQIALFAATAARRLAKRSPGLAARSNAMVGECLCLISGHKGDLDSAWSIEASIGASATEMDEKLLTPSPSAASLASAAGGGGGGKGKDKDKGKKKGKKGAEVEEEKTEGSGMDVDKLNEELEIDESGDLRAQSLELLTKSGDSLCWIGRFEEACYAHLAACEASGSALDDGKPLDAFRSLVKAQASSSSAWMEGLRAKSTETEPSSRERIFSRRISRCENDRGESGLFAEDRCFEALAGGNQGAGGHKFPPAKAGVEYLTADCEAYSRTMGLNGSGDLYVDDLLSSMPSNLRLVVLQLNADGTSVYCGVGGKNNMPSVAKLVLDKNGATELDELVKKMKSVEGSSFAKFMIGYADESGEDGDWEEEKKDLSDDGVKEGIVLSDDGEDDLKDCVGGMEGLLGEILSRPQIAAALDEAKQEKAGVVLLADPRLQMLPLEGLQALQGMSCVSRDFSARMFLSRMASVVKTGATTMKGLGYVVDPRLEDTGSANANKPRMTCNEVCEEVCGKSGPAGASSGIRGDEKIASDGEWQDMLVGKTKEAESEARAFMYYGPGRALARFSPARLSGMSARGLNLMCLFDRSENDASYRRQSKLDNQKRPDQLSLEGPIESAALFSLSGANCLVVNRWATSFHCNARLVKEVLGGLAEGSTVGAAVGKFRESIKEEEVENAEEEEKKSRGLKMRVKYNTVVFGLPFVSVSK
ncbi:hypothetical protein TrST_g6381 [Triparma strigata]|uniref:Uncharacterized protein n=1 Tax=Triparma strigata TaxID=1606541 RepID=A0A9W7AYH0_9STRA|nr:hypothetical protein TrST_g6381 [Triparma strigata]